MAGQGRVATFGPFQADLTTGELRRGDRAVHLQHQPFELLVALLERPGELVTSEQLRRRLWPEGTHVSFERGMASAMRKLREALGDNARAPIYIETLPRRGYRFIAPVCVSRPQTPPAAAGRRAANPFSTSTLRWAAVVLLTVLIGGQGRFPAGTDERVLAAESLSAYACVLKSRGEVAKALEVIRQAQALVPDSAKITAEVGFYLHAAGYYEAEFPTLRRAAELDASSPDVWLHMGLAYARREDFAKAIESLERARQLAGADRSVEKWLAWARVQQSRTSIGS
jgi:DNA-binding winged helix-turn-helix (wHTH) protein